MFVLQDFSLVGNEATEQLIYIPINHIQAIK